MFSDTLTVWEAGVNHSSGLARLALMQLERAPQLGVARATLLREAKLDESQLRDPDARIPLAAVARLWRAVTKHVPDAAARARSPGACAIRRRARRPRRRRRGSRFRLEAVEAVIS